MRTLIAAVTLVVALAVGATAAQATTGTNTVGGLTVTVSLSPDTAAVGATFTVSETIANTSANTSARLQFVKVTQTLKGPAGKTFSFSYPILLRAGRSFAFSFTFTLPPRVPLGEYTLTLTANAVSATATTVVS